MASTANRRPAIRIERTIPASAHRIYRAWLNPDLVRRWMAPGPFEASKVEIDEQVGGQYRVWHGDEEGADSGGFDSELLELVPDQRIVWRWGFVGPQRRQGPAYDSRLTITLHELGDGSTKLSLVHEQLDELAAAMPQIADSVEVGWHGVLAKLASALAEPNV